MGVLEGREGAEILGVRTPGFCRDVRGVDESGVSKASVVAGEGMRVWDPG